MGCLGTEHGADILTLPHQTRDTSQSFLQTGFYLWATPQRSVVPSGYWGFVTRSDTWPVPITPVEICCFSSLKLYFIYKSRRIGSAADMLRSNHLLLLLSLQMSPRPTTEVPSGRLLQGASTSTWFICLELVPRSAGLQTGCSWGTEAHMKHTTVYKYINSHTVYKDILDINTYWM